MNGSPRLLDCWIAALRTRSRVRVDRSNSISGVRHRSSSRSSDASDPSTSLRSRASLRSSRPPSRSFYSRSRADFVDAPDIDCYSVRMSDRYCSYKEAWRWMHASRECGAEGSSFTRGYRRARHRRARKRRRRRVRVRTATRSETPRQFASIRRPGSTRARQRRASPGDQIRERDWQPSTGTLAPLIQLARGETRNATTAPTSSGRPNRPNGSSRLTNSAIPAGSSC